MLYVGLCMRGSFLEFLLMLPAVYLLHIQYNCEIFQFYKNSAIFSQNKREVVLKKSIKIKTLHVVN